VFNFYFITYCLIFVLLFYSFIYLKKDNLLVYISGIFPDILLIKNRPMFYQNSRSWIYFYYSETILFLLILIKILQNDATSKYSPKTDNQSIFVSYAPDVITMFKFGVIDFATSFQIAKFFMQVKAP
jgi:hypothetical protein